MKDHEDNDKDVLPKEQNKTSFFNMKVLNAVKVLKKMENTTVANKSSLVCVEPQTHRTFTVNLGTENATEIELTDKSDIIGVKNKILRQGYIIDSMLTREQKQADWDFDSHCAHRYRRRMLPFYLLEKESNSFPTYVDNSDLN